MIVFDAGVADCSASFIIGPTDYSGMVVRLTDALNFWPVVYTAVSLILRSWSAGSATNRSTAAVTVAAGDRVGLTCSGTTYQLTLNGANVGSPVTVAFNTTATKVGLYLNAGAAATRWDDFRVTVP